MGFCFSKPDKKELLKDNRELIEANTRILAVCKELAQGELSERVERVYESVRYMTPTTRPGALVFDKKINAYAGDLKIALSKENDRGKAQAEDILHDMELAVAERNAYN